MTEQLRFLSSVEHIMDTHPPVISVDDSVANARDVIESTGGRPVALVDSVGAFKGMLSPESLLLDAPVPVGQLATRVRMSVAPHESAFSVVSRMLSRRIDWVPVLREGKLVGTVSRDCVKSAFGESTFI
jgi:CBS domain-containing protein